MQAVRLHWGPWGGGARRQSGPSSDNKFLRSDLAFQTPSGFSFICFRLMYWSAYVFRFGVRCDISDSLAIMCETYKYVVAKFCINNLSGNSIYCFFCLFLSDKELARHFPFDPEKN